MPEEIETKTRMFPVLLAWDDKRGSAFNALESGCSFLVVGVPWELLDACTVRIRANHGQSIERLAERGGLDPAELCAILEDRNYAPMPFEKANKRLASLIIDKAMDSALKALLDKTEGEERLIVEAIASGFRSRAT